MASVRHLQCSRPGLVWSEAVRPWLATTAVEAWQADKPTAILVPDSFAAAALKRHVALDGLPLVGVEIFTPGRLRHLLSGCIDSEQPVAVREELALLMRLAAQGLPDNPLARAVAVDPQPFLRDYDALDAAGWGGRAFRFPPAAELAMAFQEQLRAAGMRTARQADRDAQAAGEVFSRLLVTGFGPAHNEHFFLLLAAANAAAEATLVFSQPVSDAPLDFAWTEMWESLLGTAEIADGDDAPFSAQAPSLPVFHLAPDPGVEAAAIVQQVTAWLATDASPRIGIVVPHRGLTVLRETALRLDVAGIPHYDTGGHAAAREPGFLLLEAWRTMQETQRLQACVDFIACLRAQRQLLPELAEKLTRRLRDIFQETMTDDLAVTAAAAKDEALVAFFAQWPSLPARASLADFVAAARPVLEQFAWPERLDFLSDRVALLAPRLGESLERTAFLGWLGSVVDIPGRTRSESGRHPLARVALVTATEALGEDWTHLIFVGLNGTQWQPPEAASGLLDDSLCQQLNHRAGWVADGVSTLGKQGRLLSRQEKTTLLETAFRHLTQVSGAAVAYTAARGETPSATSGHAVNDLFLKAYHEVNGELPGEAACERIEARTLQGLTPKEAGTFPQARHFTAVHTNRRNAALPFDGYFFGYDNPPVGGLDFSFSQWENAFNSPGHTWIKQAIRADIAWAPERDDSLAQAMGLSVHAWLNPVRAEGAWVPQPTEALWCELVSQRASAMAARIAAAYRAAGRTLPDWWEEAHAHALGKAHALASAAASAPASQIAGEYQLPEGEVELLPDVLTLRVRGRIDLLIHEGNELEPTSGPVWLVDFKTGNRKGLTEKQFAKGDGLQLGLYALALRQLGYGPIKLCLLVPGNPLKAQLTDADVAAQTPLWEAVTMIHASGTLGHRGEFRSRYSHVGDYPLATLAIPANILASKWRLTHPELSTEAEA